jgi:hypothetical protein
VQAASPRYGPLEVTAWHRRHQRLTRQNSGWADHPGPLPVIEGTVIRLAAASRAAGYQALEPMWLWAADPAADPGQVTVLWQAYLRRFDLETSKPQCCHSRGLSALSSVPSRSVSVNAA